MPRVQHALTREIKFYQVLRLLFTQRAISLSESCPIPVWISSFPRAPARDALRPTAVFSMVSLRKAGIRNLFFIFIASLCFVCVTGDSSFESIYGAFHHNAVARRERWQSKPQLCASHCRFLTPASGDRAVVSKRALSLSASLPIHAQIFSWRYRVDAFEPNCNPSISRINRRSSNGGRPHSWCANTCA